MPDLVVFIVPNKAMTSLLEDFGKIRKKRAISLGNEANINMVDALEYLGEDEQTKAIILYVEGIRDGRRFMEVLRKYFFTCMILSVE